MKPSSPTGLATPFYKGPGFVRYGSVVVNLTRVQDVILDALIDAGQQGIDLEHILKITESLRLNGKAHSLKTNISYLRKRLSSIPGVTIAINFDFSTNTYVLSFCDKINN